MYIAYAFINRNGVMNIILKTIIKCIVVFLFISTKSIAETNNNPCYPYLDFEIKNTCSLNKKDYSDYFIQYGYKYCAIFQKKSLEWRGLKKEWTIKTQQCLLNIIEDNKEKYNCKKLEKKSIEEHASCYVKGGFCKLTFKDKAKIFFTIEFKDSILNVDIFKNVNNLPSDCLTELLTKILKINQKLQYVSLKSSMHNKLILQIVKIDDIPNNKIEEYINHIRSKLYLQDDSALGEYKNSAGKNIKINFMSQYSQIAPFSKLKKPQKKITINVLKDILKFKKNFIKSSKK